MADAPSPADGAPNPGPPDDPFYVIRDLAQLKVLADPLRVRILEALCEQPRTTKQVAERLGEKPTKLYHHVEALDRAGLIELHSTRPNRARSRNTSEPSPGPSRPTLISSRPSRIARVGPR